MDQQHHDLILREKPIVDRDVAAGVLLVRRATFLGMNAPLGSDKQAAFNR